MTCESDIDAFLDCLCSSEMSRLYDRWSREYKQRYYDTQGKIIVNKPTPHRNYPGFENNLRSLLWNVLKVGEMDPHGEWPYASQLTGSAERADIHTITPNNTEWWFELGMYASDEKAKYAKDFEKLKAVVESASANNIGILVHFEIFKRGVVPQIFNEYSTTSNHLLVNYKEFTDGHQLIACRLIIEKNSGAIENTCFLKGL